MRIEGTTQPAPRPTTVDPSRAWILGLVVDSDGSLSVPAPADSAWPSTLTATPPAADATADHTMHLDGPTVP